MVVPSKTNVTSTTNADTLDVDVAHKRKGWSAYIIHGTDLLLPYSANSANISIDFTGAEQARSTPLESSPACMWRDALYLCLLPLGSASQCLARRSACRVSRRAVCHRALDTPMRAPSAHTYCSVGV